MLGRSFGLAHVAQRTFGLLLHVLQDLNDAAAVRLVGRGSRSIDLGVVVSRLRLHEGGKLLLVAGVEGCSIEHSADGLQHAIHVAGVDLRQRRGVLGRLLRQDADRAVQRVDGVDELGLTRHEVGVLLLADECRVLELGLHLRDAAGELLDLHPGDLDLAAQLVDVRLKLRLLLGGVVDGELPVLRRVVAPVEVLLEGLGRHLALRDDLGGELVHQLQHLAQRVGLLREGGTARTENGERKDGLHCCVGICCCVRKNSRTVQIA
mmetsp:Transcript_15665/g.41507  ORF Transcript_15665/g.41507 Transcript_15665/m.41507 type:complete len:264 (+) Transcript_15665:616-1407(+)